MTRRAILTAAVALLGLALTAALAWSASQLAGQRIGLASEPLSVVQGLAPHDHVETPQPSSRDDRGAGSSRPAPNQTAATTSTGIFTSATPAAPATTSAPPTATSPTGASSGASPPSEDHQPDD